MRDFLKGTEKVRKIMGGTSYICRHCGLAYDKFMKADNCCKHKKEVKNAT